MHLEGYLSDSAQVNSQTGTENGRENSREDIDQSWLQHFLIRWKLAEEYLEDLPETGIAADYALRCLLTRDIPALAREIVRLRPELR